MDELPSIGNVIGILQKCRKSKNLAYAKQVHAQICNNGLELHKAVGNYIVPMFVECRSVCDAQKVFDRLVCRNVYSWTSLISGYIESGKSQHALDLYQKMQEDSVHPSNYTFVALLKACARLKDVEKGREIHVEIAQKGFERDVFVGSSLVDMYAKCGSIVEAREAFDKLPVPNVVSWNALIAGYAEHGPGQEALKCFEKMQLDGFSPDVVTCVSVLKACGSIGAIDKGREIHIGITPKGYERDVFVGSTLINMYTTCGLLAEARKVFDKLPVRDVVAWTALMVGYAEYGPCLETLKCFEQMHLEGVSPDAATIVCILKACGNIGAIGKGREIRTHIARNGFERDTCIGIALVDMYAKCGSLAEAWEVMDTLPGRNIVAWNALIAGYAEHGPDNKALNCFEQMQREGIVPNAITFVCIVKVCGSLRAIDKGREVHADITRNGFDRDILIGNTLVSMYAKCGSLAESSKVFNKLPIRKVESWTALIAGYAEHGPGQEALKCFEEMQFEGVSPDAVTFACVVKACGSIGAIDKGCEVHVNITRKGFDSDVIVGSALVDMYAKCGLLAEAQEVFDKLPVRNVVSWTALIAGYAEHGPGQEALTCFERMQLEDVFPDIVSFVCVLKACGSIGALDKGRELHADIAQKGFAMDISISCTLIDMYAQCGSLAEAQEVFDKLPVQSAVLWNALVKAYGMNHEGNMAIQCFEKMQEQGVKPDDTTFACLLTACSRAGLALKGQEFFNAMREDYGIVPTIAHYIPTIDVLAKSGHLHEAEKFLETMPCPPSWTALLSACTVYGEAELGLKCFQQLFQMNPECAAPYVLLAKIYASAGRWDDACSIEQLRKQAGAKKKPATALIEVNKKVHEFVVGNNTSKEISAMLELFSSRSKEEGHVPGINVVLRPISDEEKEAALCEHAEKLAVAFGLLNTPQGQTLRVTKNLRMCYDCHNTIKIISRIERREIIVRDTYQAHHMKNGLCSCGDVC